MYGWLVMYVCMLPCTQSTLNSHLFLFYVLMSIAAAYYEFHLVRNRMVTFVTSPATSYVYPNFTLSVEWWK